MLTLQDIPSTPKFPTQMSDISLAKKSPETLLDSTELARSHPMFKQPLETFLRMKVPNTLNTVPMPTTSMIRSIQEEICYKQTIVKAQTMVKPLFMKVEPLSTRKAGMGVF